MDIIEYKKDLKVLIEYEKKLLKLEEELKKELLKDDINEGEIALIYKKIIDIKSSKDTEVLKYRVAYFYDKFNNKI